MDDGIINRPSGRAKRDKKPSAKANNPWPINLTIRPKANADSRFSDDQPNMSQRASSAILLSSSPPHLSSGDNSEVSSDSDEALQTPPSIESCARQGQLYSFGSPCKGQNNKYGHALCQTDGADEAKRALPAMRNHLLTDSVPDYVDIVSNRRLHRLHLDTGVFDFAYVRVPLPEGIVSAVFNPSPSFYSLLRRSCDGYFSAMAMFKAAFPNATAEEVASEREYFKSIPTMKTGVYDDNPWIDPAWALELANEYYIVPYIQALLDPAEITIQKASADGKFQQILAPPKYTPTALAPGPVTLASVADEATQIPGDGSPLGPDGKPITRMFDPQMSLKHQDVPANLLTILDPVNHVVHLQNTDPATNMLQPDSSSLVIAIDGVIYTRGGDHRQGGATVFFHHTYPWNSLAYLRAWDPHTKEQALLEGLCQALIMIKALVATDPHLREVRIMTSSRELCMLFGLGIDRIGDEDAALLVQWLENTDKTYWTSIERRWRDITDARAVDVRLWHVAEEVIQPATEVAIAEMYRADGRDWYAENGKGHDPLKPKKLDEPANSSNINGNYCGTDITLAVENKVRHFLDQMGFIPPQSIADRGSSAVANWATETMAKYKQAMLLLEMVSREYDAVTNIACSDPGRGRRHKEHWEAHSRVRALARARQNAAVHFHRFMAEHPILLHAGDFEVEKDCAAMDLDTVGGDLVQTVVEMVLEDEELNQAGNEMDWE